MTCPKWFYDPHDDAPQHDTCVGCVLLDPDLTPHENMEEAYRLGFHYGNMAGRLGHQDGPEPCPRCEEWKKREVMPCETSG